MYIYSEGRSKEEALEMIANGTATIEIIAKRIKDACDQIELESVVSEIQSWLKARIAYAIQESQNPKNDDFTRNSFEAISNYWENTLEELKAGRPFYMPNAPNLPSLGGFTVPRNITDVNDGYMYEDYQPQSA